MKNPKKSKNLWKLWAGRIHLWLGLLTGIIVFIVAVTGCIYVFHDEIKDVVYDWRKVEVENKQFVAPSELKRNIAEKFPQASSDFLLYPGRDRPAMVFGRSEGEEFYFYLNPYSGEFLAFQNLHENFFDIVLHLHMYLLLPEDIGKQVIGISTIIFVIMLITGVILWWPKKLKNLRRSLKIKWNSRWRRLNYDLHNISGIYLHLLALVIAITGLTFSYEWVDESVYYLGNLGTSPSSDQVITRIDAISEETSENPLDKAFYKSLELTPEDEMHFVWLQAKNSPIVAGSYPKALHYDHQSNFYYHPKTGKLLQEQYYTDKSSGLKLQEMNYGLHTGQYFGMVGKIIVFLASLFVAALPITGFMIWWGRKNRVKHLTR